MSDYITEIENWNELEEELLEMDSPYLNEELREKAIERANDYWRSKECVDFDVTVEYKQEVRRRFFFIMEVQEEGVKIQAKLFWQR